MMIALVFAVAATAAPQQDSAAFVRRFVAAVNAASPAQRRTLQHPKDAACAATSFIEEITNRQRKNPVPARYEWRISKVAPGPLPFEGIVTYAVRPTHQLQIDYRPTPYHSVTVVVRLVRAASGWHEVFGCPTRATLAKMDSVKRIAEKRKLEVARRIDTMPRQVRDSILALHLNGKGLSAVYYYAAAEKLDTTTANDVADSVSARHRLAYKYEYPHNTAKLVEDHYIVIDTIDGSARGWYYGTTDDFDSAREGYTPGFFVAPMRNLSFAHGAIAFSLTLDPDQLFHEPLPPTIRDGSIYAPTHRRWRTVRLSGSRTYRGAVSGDTISLQLERGARVFRRTR
jgi:hypothetical protein